MSSYDIYFRRPSSSLNSAEYCAYFSWKPFEGVCGRVHERATRLGHARLANASQPIPGTKSIDISQLDAAGWKLVIEEVDAMLADSDLHAWQKERREKDSFIQWCLREGLDADDFLRDMRKSTEAQLRLLRDKLTEMVERGEGPSPRDRSCELLRHSDIYFLPYEGSVDPHAGHCASFYGRPFGVICRRIQERSVRLGNANLAEAAEYAQLDGYLEVNLLDAAARQLVMDEVNAILSDAEFYAYEQEQSQQAWFIESCQRQGQTTDEFQRAVRESTAEQLRHLREKLTELVSADTAQVA